VAQTRTVGVGEQNGDKHFLRREFLDTAGHPVEYLAQGCLPGRAGGRGRARGCPLSSAPPVRPDVLHAVGGPDVRCAGLRP
jgi:hypothetical protein